MDKVLYVYKVHPKTRKLTREETYNYNIYDDLQLLLYGCTSVPLNQLDTVFHNRMLFSFNISTLEDAKNVFKEHYDKKLIEKTEEIQKLINEREAILNS